MFLYSYLFKSFPQFSMMHRVKDFGVVDKTEVEFFLECAIFFSGDIKGMFCPKLGTIKDINVET